MLKQRRILWKWFLQIMPAVFQAITESVKNAFTETERISEMEIKILLSNCQILGQIFLSHSEYRTVAEKRKDWPKLQLGTSASARSTPRRLLATTELMYSSKSSPGCELKYDEGTYYKLYGNHIMVATLK